MDRQSVPQFLLQPYFCGRLFLLVPNPCLQLVQHYVIALQAKRGAEAYTCVKQELKQGCELGIKRFGRANNAESVIGG